MKTKTKKEREFNGTKYASEQTSETARNKSVETGLNCQCDIYANIDTKHAEIWQQMKNVKYQRFANFRDYPFSQNNLNNQPIKIKFDNGLQCIHVPMGLLHENSGLKRAKGSTYFPQLQYYRNNDSITTFAKNCETATKRLEKLGLL